MQSYFTSEFFISNRQRLRELVNSDVPIVITANGLLQRGGDSTFSFSQDANFWYLTGIDEPDVILVMEFDNEYLIVPERDASRTAFDGAVDDSGLTRRSGIKNIYEPVKGWEQLKLSTSDNKQAAVIPAVPAYLDRHGLYVNPARRRLQQQLKTAVPELELVDIAIHIVHQRMVKQPAELRAIQSAIDITMDSIKAATTQAKLAKYTHEYQLEAEIAKGFRYRGASGHSFEPIIAGGQRACTLHNVANNEKLTSGELVVIDVGAEVEHYAADITRTIAYGPISQRAQAVHDAVADVQRHALSLLKPGVVLGDYEKQIENYMGTKLVELGLIKSVTHEAVRKYYPHATSHFLGLNVHDAGDYDLPLAPGMVITVEPGIYITEEGIGVRIEDDVLITAKGVKVLSKRLKSSLA